MSIQVVLLRREHRALLADFRNQQESLVHYLKRFALRHTESDLLGKTFLALDGQTAGDRVAGYFTLSAASVERQLVAKNAALDRLPRFPIPAVLLARLAVDERAQGQGLGRYLFEEALGRSLQLALAGPVGLRLLVTDAIDEEAAKFYEHFGLVRLSDTFPCRMVLDLAPLVAK